MSNIHRWTFGVLCRCVRGLLRVRYKIEVRGLEKILLLKKSYPGVLFLPNHPAEIDPVILTSILGPYFFPRSVVVEHFYYLKWFKRVLDFSRVVPIPSLEENAGVWKKKQLAQSLIRIGKEIEAGENYIIYPSGKLKRTGMEKIGGASFVHTLLQNHPTIPVVLVRTTGLWGSSFSYYGKNKSPDFGKTLVGGFKTLIKGGLFFIPKRKVLVEFEVCDELSLQKDRLIFNQSLESWYNRYSSDGEERAFLVPYSFFKIRQEAPSEEGKAAPLDVLVNVSEKVQSEVFSYLAILSKVPKEKIHQHSSLAFDLGLDSLDVAEIHAFLDKNYDVGGVPLSSLQKVSDLLRAITEKEENAILAKQEEQKNIPRWFKKEKRKPLMISRAEVIPEAFLDNCDRMGSLIACADAGSGALSYKQCKRAVLILAKEFSLFRGEKVAVLLPSAVAANLSILALLIAGKIPVMLNWTSGRNGLNQAKKLAGFTVTLTSKKFLNKIYLEDLGEVEETFVFLEEIKEGLSLKVKLKGLFESFFSTKTLMKRLRISKDSSGVAVILFTSGTEATPKAVPLFHRHLLTNQKSALSLSGLQEIDSLYGVLPPFHSFGFSLTGLFPLLSGLKVFYAPDPRDGHGMASDIHKMKISVICLAPSFIRALFSSASLEQLQSLRLIVSGAEKPSQELSLFVKEYLPLAVWREGYGITECSPIVSLQPRNLEPKGVGRLLSQIEVCVVEPHSLHRIPDGERGELCIRGPSVFEGYLDGSSDPFIEIEGKRWYRSGDLGWVDSEGNLYLTDRLKRTVKIGGEMISLGAVEEELLHAAKERMWYTSPKLDSPTDIKAGPSLVVMAVLSEKPELILFTTLTVSADEVNRALREGGVSRIIKISRVITLSEIPLMGTGKVHYRELEEKIRCMYVSNDPSSPV
ncbi:MAG: AMP-binding protein [Chlamydiota bacterium]